MYNEGIEEIRAAAKYRFGISIETLGTSVAKKKIIIEKKKKEERFKGPQTLCCLLLV